LPPPLPPRRPAASRLSRQPPPPHLVRRPHCRLLDYGFCEGSARGYFEDGYFEG
jgi:hypothetical protein